MTLLATSTPRRRKTVRVLFYGQSITQGAWWQEVADDLLKRFPNADLRIENRAIGGFAADLLGRTVKYDVLPYYPDLVIFHDYGGEPEYEAIVKLIRSQTTAEMLLMDDMESSPEKPGDPEPAVRRQRWHDAHSVWLRGIADKYGCEFASIREPWKNLVRSENLMPLDVTTDGTHPNERGNHFMASLVSPYLQYDPRSKPVEVTKEYPATWKRSRLKLAFEGNRVDLIPKRGGDDGKPAQILIDGRPPSSFAEAYAFTRPSNMHGAWFPAILKFGPGAVPLIEDWKLTVTEVGPDDSFRYRIEGTRTGPDGEGSSAEDFVSRSGRIRIGKADWSTAYAFAISKQKVRVGFEVRWRVEPRFLDAYVRPDMPDGSLEYAVTAIQGISNGKHTLEIVGEAPIEEVRVYRPPVSD
jgi:hypothetical protein